MTNVRTQKDTEMKPALRARKVELSHTPMQVVARLTHLPGLIFLDSSGNLPSSYANPLTIIAVNPRSIRRGTQGEMLELQVLLDELNHHYDDCIPSYIPLGGWFGWIEYEGDFCFGFYQDCLIYDHSRQQWFEVGDVISQCKNSRNVATEIGEFTSSMSRDSYIQKVNRIKEYITAGDIYQVNLAQKFSADVVSDHLLSLYRSLRAASPAPMAAYVNLGGKEVLSSSPETFVSMQNRVIETRPIKGTRPRFDDPLRDAQSAEELQASDKERAELVMITDLERNDIGQVCEYGSVNVDELLKLEKLEHVYHLVSTVSGVLRAEVSHVEALLACFPGGSITGAPKHRAREIITELEELPRGLYTGAIGYFGAGNVSQFSIVIRTLVKEKNTLHYHVGAGIVADSDAAAEYQETLQKAKGMKRALLAAGH